MSISRKFTIWITALVLVLGVTTIYLYYTFEMSEELERLESLGATVGPLVEENLANYMLTKDRSVLNKTLDTLKGIEPISSIWLINREGVIKAGTDSALVGVKLSPTDSRCRRCHEKGERRIVIKEENIFRWIQPVRNKPECHKCHSPEIKHNGIILIDLSLEKAQKYLKKDILRGSLIFILSMITIGFFMLVLSKKLVTKKLQGIIDAIKRFEKGNHNAEISIKGTDEITKLGNTFNEMAEVINKREEELERYTKELLSLADASNVIDALSITENVYQAICDIAVRNFGLKMAWLGLIDKGSYDVKPVAQSGFEEGYLSAVKITGDDAPTGMGPTGMAIKTKTARIMHNIDTDPAYALWREEAIKRGYRSSMALPLTSSEGKVTSVLNLYSSSPMFFTDKRIKIFQIFSSQAAAAIENRSLIEKLTEQIRLVSHSQKEWQDTFDSITDLVSIHDKDFNIIKVNEAIGNYFGIDIKEIIGRKCYKLFHDCDLPVPNCPHKRTIQGGKSQIEEVVDPKTNKIFRVMTFPYTSPTGELIGSIHIARDITEEKEKEMRLIMNERLASLGQMASGIAHEINNPLASIAGCAERLAKKVKSDKYDPELFENYLNIVKEEVMRCKNITTNMLSFVRMPIEKKNVDINHVISKTLEIIGFQGKWEKVGLVKNYADGFLFVKGDEGALRQAVLAIIINSLDAMQDSGTLTLETGKEGEKVFIKIADTGPGIPSEIMHNIFNPFFTTKSDSGGTGLGLSIAKRIVLDHEGEIDVTSEEGKGTIFRIVLPAG